MRIHPTRPRPDDPTVPGGTRRSPVRPEHL